ncbi:MAG: hypothetical protein QW134_09645 [Nitrososphaeria archaeon]
MELFEAFFISFINTAMVLALHRIKVKTKRNIEVHGPFSYELDESGALKELQAQHVLIELAETLRKKILSEIKPSKTTINKKLAIAIFALTIFIIQLIILLSV